VLEINMENVTEAGDAYTMDTLFEECATMTEQEVNDLLERVKGSGEPRKEIIHTISTGERDSSVWRDLTNDSLDLAKGLKYVTSAVKELSLSAGFATESAETFIAAWRDGKWVPTGGRSSKRKMGVGGKRW
jgi:hypothetical protein